MQKQKVFVLVGHPDTESMCREFGNSYIDGAKSTGHDARLTCLGDLRFDPILHKGYKVIQELESDLLKLQEDIRWCDHLVIIYPSWWSTMPAILKGMFDRIWLPGFAFKFLPNGWGWQKLLHGRTATVFVTSDSRPILARFLFGDNVNEIRDGILWFAGFRPHIKKIGPMKHISPERKTKWLKIFKNWGKALY
jgi:NAD(P)H dehydrogenase (quinone)